MTQPDYRNGGEGFCAWAEEFVRIPIYPQGSAVPAWYSMAELPEEPQPETGRSYKQMWEEQKGIFKEALAMSNGRFLYRVIVFCWMRGEGKSLAAVLIQLWKFFNWPRQHIVCGANSKEQTKFVHYDIMKSIINGSPKLLAMVGKKSIKEKEIAYRDQNGNIQSSIRCISSFSGIVSNITGYTFSEIFDMKNPKFFVQLDGSTRNIPNAIGVIDSTVSDRTHILHKLFQTFSKSKDPTLYFSYRYSKNGEYQDYWNPQMTQIQLDSYREKFPLGDFERYFLNLWSAGAAKVFTPEMIEATHYIGLDNKIGPHDEMISLIKQRNDLVENAKRSGVTPKMGIHPNIAPFTKRFWPIDEVMSLKANDRPRVLENFDLKKLGDIYDTDWAVTVGLDRADPLKIKTTARTIVCAVAKGLIGSRRHPFNYNSNENPPYLYVVIHVTNIDSHALEAIKNEIDLIHKICEVDIVGSERWGAWDLESWATQKNIKLELWQPTYDRQKAMFSELFLAYKQGRFKCPPLAVYGTKGGDILEEEASCFDHDPDAKWFGSVEKREKYGTQDDAMFSIGAAIYSGMELSPIHFRERKTRIDFGIFIPQYERQLGVYG